MMYKRMMRQLLIEGLIIAVVIILMMVFAKLAVSDASPLEVHSESNEVFLGFPKR